MYFSQKSQEIEIKSDSYGSQVMEKGAYAETKRPAKGRIIQGAAVVRPDPLTEHY